MKNLLNNPSSQEDFALLRELENIEKRSNNTYNNNNQRTATNKLAKKNLAKVYGKANFAMNSGLPPKTAANISRNKQQSSAVGSYSKFHLP
jgi:hypothetical protein